MFASAEQQRQKHQVGRIFVVFLLGLTAVHLIDDYVAGRWDEVGLNSLQLLLIAATAVFLRPEHMRPTVLWSFSVAVLLVPLYLVAKGGGDGTFIFYLVFVPPVAIYFLGFRSGFLLSTAALATTVGLLLINPLAFTYTYETLLRFFGAYVVLTIVTGALEAARAGYAEQLELRTADLIREREALEAAQRDIKKLSGLLPICCACKNIRADDNRWESIESYIAKHSEADFSHTVCPTCSEQMYPDIQLHG